MSPIDNLNLNRVFPGRPKGSFMERLAWSLVQRAMRHASIYIDLHGGDLAEALVPFALCQQTGNPAVDAQSPRMATAFGSSSLTEQHPSAAPITGPAVAAAARLRIQAIIAEDGGASLYAPAVAARMPAGLENVLRTLMFWTALCRIFRRRAASPNSSGSDSHAAGFFKQSVQVGDDTEAGTPSA